MEKKKRRKESCLLEERRELFLSGKLGGKVDRRMTERRGISERRDRLWKRRGGGERRVDWREG